MILKGVVMLATDRQTYGLPSFFGDAPLRIGGASASTQMLWNLGTAVLAVVLLAAFFRTTRRGTMLRAAADDREVLQSIRRVVPQHGAVGVRARRAARRGLPGPASRR